MEKITPLEAFKKSQEWKAEYNYLAGIYSMVRLPSSGIQRNPLKKRLQQELRFLSKNPAFRKIVKYIRKRFWIPPHHTFTLSLPESQHAFADFKKDRWIDIEQERSLSDGIEIKVGGMGGVDVLDDLKQWEELIEEKSKEFGEPQRGVFRLHIRWLLNDLGLPGQYGQALEQYILFGEADLIPAFEIHRGDHAGIYHSGPGSLCIEIYPYTKASDITRHWSEVQQAMKQLWGTRGTRPRIAPNLERDYEWLRLVTQEGKSPRKIADSYLELDRKTPRQIADSDLEFDQSYDEIDETVVRTAVNRLKKRLEANS